MRRTSRIATVLLLGLSLILLIGCHRLEIPAMTRTERVALKSYHGRYVSALGVGEDWAVTQHPGPEPDDCAWFTAYHLGEDSRGYDRIALETCYGRFVTAPRRGTTRLDRLVWQESGFGDCGQFIVEPQDNGKFALMTCAGKYLTTGDDGPTWPVPWAIVVQDQSQPTVEEWETFTIVAP